MATALPHSTEGRDRNSESEDVREEGGTNSQTTVIVSLQRDKKQRTLHTPCHFDNAVTPADRLGGLSPA
ncbi:hypothetical protein PBY51_002036 [Eleginops maclovinus]|uniref:Uncharacterized protein n=1 Tax=Eleginops maclovinus TaxID=56733 RepID=A0AAN7WYN9_ELEMC|nr:hypothetical protein PBY51_002036 [Eleginops maclovinus]